MNDFNFDNFDKSFMIECYLEDIKILYVINN